MDKNSHKLITEYSVELLKDYYEEIGIHDLLDLLNNQKESMAQGSAAEDNLSWGRISNWHFYNRDNAFENRNWPGRRTSEEVFFSRIMTIKDFLAEDNLDEDDYQDLFGFVGRLLHHIQDMSTPSHVVPVFHGVKIKDSLETFLTDILKTELEHVNGSLLLSEFKSFDSVLSKGNSFYQLLNFYEDRAKRSLQLLFGENATLFEDVNDKTISGKTFWKQGEEFGEFTEGGKIFSQFSSSLTCSDPIGFTVDGEEYSMTYSQCRKYVFTFVEKSIVDTMAALDFILTKLMN